MRLYGMLLCAALLSLLSCAGNGKTEPAGPDTSPDTGPALRTFEGTDNLIPVRMAPQQPDAVGAWPVSTPRRASAAEQGLPMPSQLVGQGPSKRPSEYTESDLRRVEYDETLPHNNMAGTFFLYGGQFSPNWDGGEHASLSDTAYCIFRFTVPGIADSGMPQTISTDWEVFSDTTSDLSKVWIGLPDIGKDRWEWFLAPEDNVLTLESLAPYCSATGDILVAFVVVSDQRYSLKQLFLSSWETRGTGSEEEADPLVDNFPPPALTELYPLEFDLSQDCSPIGDQGEVPSCTCFAAARGAFDYRLGQLYKDDGWDFGQAINLSSTQYLFILTGETEQTDCSVGRPTSTPILQLVDGGDASELNAPPQDDCLHSWEAAADDDATLLRASGMYAIDPGGTDGVRKIKSALVTRRQIPILASQIDHHFAWLSADEVWVYSGDYLSGGHAMCIVGYSDTKGAFRVRNSWGPAWADGGYCWIGYENFLSHPTELDLRCYTISVDYDAAVAERFCGAGPRFSPPTRLNASKGSMPDRIKLSWDPVVGATSYKVYRDANSNLLATIGPLVEWEDLGVPDTFTHTYWVQACSATEESMLSEPDLGYLAAGT